MFRNIATKVCFLIFCLLSVVGLSACCSPNDVKVNVIFDQVDVNMGVESYTTKVGFGKSFDLEFVIPEGYDHSTLTAMLDDMSYEYEVELENPNVQEEYEYSTGKKIFLHVKKVTRDIDIKFDMSRVRKRQFRIQVDSDIINTTRTEEKPNSNKYLSNLKLVTINPDYKDNLISLDANSINGEIQIDTNFATVDYGEYVALIYTKNTKNDEISVMYSGVGHFTDEDKVLNKGLIKYTEYNVATKGRIYYNAYENNVLNPNTRIYYIGRVQEHINLYKEIPGYKLEQGFVIENNENKFSLLTNKKEHSSEMLDIKIFAPTEKTYNSDDTIDQINETVIEEIDGNFVFNNRYDAYNMYIGNNIAIDPLITNLEREELKKELYIYVDTQEFLKDHLNISLLTYEKQNEYDSTTYRLDFDEYLISKKGGRYYKINTDIINKFLIERTTALPSKEIVTYKTGNAILSVAINPEYMDETRLNHTFPYSSINYPTIYGSQKGIVYDYEIEFYILNKDGSKDYGFLDMHKHDEDIVFFETNKLWEKKHGEWVCLNNLYITVTGPAYDDYYSSGIERIYLELNYDGHIVSGGIPVENPKVFNGIKDYPVDISGLKDEPNPINQYKIEVSLLLSGINSDKINVDFSGMQFTNQYNDVVYMTNDLNAVLQDKVALFERVDSITCTGNIDISFGATNEIYYFVTANSAPDFDIYVGYIEEGTNKYVGYKDESRKISSTKKLCDIAGNEIKIEVNGRLYNVYVKYQNCDVYNLQGNTHFAFNL